MRATGKLVFVALLMLGLEGCASRVMDYSLTPMPRERGQTRIEEDTHKPIQCAPYAREHSNIKLYGDAYTWWDKAAGKYPRGSRPESGAIMVLSNYAGDTRGHLAVVRRLIGPREIRVDHANWLNDGSIYVNNPVEDVSSDNDWSVVRVYNLKTGGWGTKLYPVQGFIGSGDGQAAKSDQTADNGGTSMGATVLVSEIN